MAPTTGRESDKFMLRLPEGMRSQLKSDAEKNGRSMNVEMIARIEAWPHMCEEIAKLENELQRISTVLDGMHEATHTYERLVSEKEKSLRMTEAFYHAKTAALFAQLVYFKSFSAAVAAQSQHIPKDLAEMARDFQYVTSRLVDELGESVLPTLEDISGDFHKNDGTTTVPAGEYSEEQLARMEWGAEMVVEASRRRRAARKGKKSA